VIHTNVNIKLKNLPLLFSQKRKRDIIPFMNRTCALISSGREEEYKMLLINELNKRDLAVESFSHEESRESQVFTPGKFGAIILLDAGYIPAAMMESIDFYLKKGGNILTLGGPLGREKYCEIDGIRWNFDQIKETMGKGGFQKKIVLGLDNPQDLKGFIKDTYNPDSKKYEGKATLTLCHKEEMKGPCVKYHTPDFVINESFEKDISLPKDHNALGFYAMADSLTKTITLVLIDEEGDMYKTRITPSEKPEFFLLCQKDFVYAGSRSLKKHSQKPGPVDFSRVKKIQFGHSLSHAYSVAGEHTFYLKELSSANIPGLNDKFISLDGLYPEYKFYPVRGGKAGRTSLNAPFLTKQEYSLPADLFSLSPRAQSTGFNKGRRYRFIPLIEAYDDKDILCGYGAYMILNFSTGELENPLPGSGIIAFTTDHSDFYLEGGAKNAAEALDFLLSPVILLEGGAEGYIYLSQEDQALFGCHVLIRDGSPMADYSVKFTLPSGETIIPLFEFISPAHGTSQNNNSADTLLSCSFTDTPSEGQVKVELLKGSTVIDCLGHEILLHKSKTEHERHFATRSKETNEILVGSRVQRFFGVNYMPSCNTGLEYGPEFEHYVSSFAYDPDIIENDLRRIKEIGMNLVSLFFHYQPSIESYNILHLVTLCEKYGLFVDLSLRPRANPFDFDESQVREMITKYRFQENDTIVAYDIAWERYVGTYEPCYGNFKGRKSFDIAWREFLINRYESFEKAEKIFGCSLPRNNNEEVTGLCDDMLREEGTHNSMTAVYRRFIDDQVALAHIRACDFIRTIDPHHLLSARTGDASTIPLVDPGIYGYDYKALSSSLDFMSPESYALTDDPQSMRQIIFTNIYSRYANKSNVVQWKEFGKSIWTGSNFTDNSVSLEFQAEFYRRFFTMLIKGHTSGLYAWWWAGGYRIGEMSDFGIINPDGTDRPVTKVFREYASLFLNAPPLKKATRQIFIDRDLHPDGLLSLYRNCEEELFAVLEQGEMVEFFDGGTGKTSANVELTEVGNTSAQGILPKYLNGLIIEAEIIQKDDKELQLSVTAINTEQSLWLKGEEFGSVQLTSLPESDYAFTAPLEKDTPQHGRAYWNIPLPSFSEGTIVFSLQARERTFFGGKYDREIHRKQR
jgi:hypothetical protein